MRASKVLCTCTAAATDAAVLSLLMITVSIGGSRGRVEPLPLLWMVLAAGCALLNLLLFRHGVPVPALAAVNSGYYALTLALFLTLFPLVEGPFGYLMTVAFPIVSTGRAVYHAWHTPALQTQLTRIDGTLACIVWALLLAGGEHPAGLLPGSLGVLLILHAVCAVALRVSGPAGEGASAPLVGAPVRGVLFSAGVVAVLTALVLGLTRLLGGGSKAAVSAFFEGIKAVFQALWGALDAFFGWLFSLFPQVEADTPPPISAAPPPSAADPAGEVMAGLLPFAAALIGAAAAVGLIVLLLRLRRVSLRAGGKTVLRRGGPVTRARRTGLLGRRWRALLEELRFRLLALRYASTPAGLLVRLEQWGRRRKLPRGRGESVRAYLLRLDPEGDLLPLADALDARFYGPPGGSTLTPAQCRALRLRFLRKARAAGKFRKSVKSS